MRKLAIVVLMFIIVLGGANTNRDFTLLDYFSGEYRVFTSVENGDNCIDLGFCYMGSSVAKENIVGESVEVENLEIGSALKTLNAKVVKTEYLENGTTIIYAFTNLIDDTVKVEGRNVNLQFATKNETTTIGWPLILGSY